MINNCTSALRPLGAGESISGLISSFSTGLVSERFPGLSLSQEQAAHDIGCLLVKEYGHMFPSFTGQPKDFQAAVIFSYVVGMMRMMNYEHVSKDVARKTFFGPWPSEVGVHPEDGDVVIPGFEGVMLVAVMPHALRLLDPSQKHVQTSADLVLPKDWHQWETKKDGVPLLQRISIVPTEELMGWVDRVMSFGGIPRVVVSVCDDSSGPDILPEGNSPCFAFDFLSGRNLIQIKGVPDGLDTFFATAVTHVGTTIDEVKEFLTLHHYKKIIE